VATGVPRTEPAPHSRQPEVGPASPWPSRWRRARARWPPRAARSATRSGIRRPAGTAASASRVPPAGEQELVQPLPLRGRWTLRPDADAPYGSALGRRTSAARRPEPRAAATTRATAAGGASQPSRKPNRQDYEARKREGRSLVLVQRIIISALVAVVFGSLLGRPRRLPGDPRRSGSSLIQRYGTVDHDRRTGPGHGRSDPADQPSAPVQPVGAAWPPAHGNLRSLDSGLALKMCACPDKNRSAATDRDLLRIARRRWRQLLG
jgi:hypothetical protein